MTIKKFQSRSNSLCFKSFIVVLKNVSTVIFVLLVTFQVVDAQNSRYALKKVNLNDIQKFVFQYDEDLNTLSKKEFQRESEDADWEISDKDTYHWYPSGNIKERLVFRKDKDKKLVRSFKTGFFYNENGNLSRKEMYYFRSGKWSFDRKTLFEYEGGKLVTVLYKKQEEEEKEMVFSGKRVIKYNDRGQKILDVSYSDGKKESELDPEKKTKFLYEKDQVVEKVTYYKHNWGDKKGQWVGSRKLQYSYNGDGQTKKVTHLRIKDQKWRPVFEIVNSYDKKERIEKQVMHRYDENERYAYLRTEFSYAPMKTGSKIVMPYMEQDGDENPYIFKKGKAKSLKRFKWNKAEEEWELKESLRFSWIKD